MRTNRSETALQAYDRGVISAGGLRRETGFEESDAPTAEEHNARKQQPSTGNQDENQPRPKTACRSTRRRQSPTACPPPPTLPPAPGSSPPQTA
ncbi:hypothetical protein [Streptomyces mirabilis]|uniref:hypothetical protein n=1 Tax=Streptomyces mirabilis TaxID=68239 RepID=UPI0036959E15